MIEIDGSEGEGGGQIVRTSIGLSAITGKSVRICNIRAGRCNPGLQPQHITGIRACAKICGAEVVGDERGCTEIIFKPGKIRGGNYKFDVGTAGAISLVLQTLVLPSIHADAEINMEITGGTHVRWSPSYDYFQHIFCDFLKKVGIEIFVEIGQYGFYPKGGGKVFVNIKPCKEFKKLDLIERGEFKRIDAWSIASENLKKANVAERQVKGAKNFLNEKFENENILYVPSKSTGSAIHIHAHYENCKIGASSLGEIGKPAEAVGKECAELFKKQINSDACLDEWMADQILPYLAFATGRVSVSEVTKHCLTNIWVIEKFLPVKFKIHGNLGEQGIIEVVSNNHRF